MKSEKRCERCSKKFIVLSGRGRPRKFCTHACTVRAKVEREREVRRQAPARTISCVVCKKECPRGRGPKTCCSPECQIFHRRSRPSYQEYLARNRRNRRTHRKVCERCKKKFTTRKNFQRFCSTNCCVRLRREKDTARRFIPRPCQTCKKDFRPVSSGRVVFCPRCRSERDQMLRSIGGNCRRRARYYGVPYESVDVHAIFKRDKWICQICKKPTLQRVRGTKHPKAPEIDHMIPMARGGPHNWNNLQCAHRKCNSTKGAKV